MMKFSSKVVTTSSTPSRAFKSAGPSSINAPASAAASIISTNNTGIGQSKPVPPCMPPTATAANAPAYNWPSAPMLKSRARNATATARPVRINGMARVSVSLQANFEPKPPSISKAKVEPTGLPAHITNKAATTSVAASAHKGAITSAARDSVCLFSSLMRQPLHFPPWQGQCSDVSTHWHRVPR